jgi:hypothetical protein
VFLQLDLSKRINKAFSQVGLEVGVCAQDPEPHASLFLSFQIRCIQIALPEALPFNFSSVNCICFHNIMPNVGRPSRDCYVCRQQRTKVGAKNLRSTLLEMANLVI